MSEIIVTAGAAGTTEQPLVPTPEQRIAAATALISGAGIAPDTKVNPQGTSVQKPVEPAQKDPPLAEVIRAQRAARERAQAEAQKAKGLESELQLTKAELDKIRAASSEFEADPVAYAQARGWTKEQQLLFGQALLYDLAPEKADPSFRQTMFEQRQAREQAKREKEAREREEKQATEAQRRQFEDYIHETASAVRGFEAGSFPESEAWFGGDFDTYMHSLMATARNIADQATKRGEVADLTAPAIARVLEADVARRMAARDQRKQPRTAPETPAAPQKPATVPADGVQPIETMSQKNLNGNGAPLPPANSDKERIQRAVAAGFRNR